MDVMKKITRIIEDIKTIKIQGARSVAKAGIEALILYARYYEGKDFSKRLKRVMRDLIAARPTEPMLRNYLTWMTASLPSDNPREALITRGKIFLKEISENFKRIVEYGSNIIEDDFLVYTYCHSSTAVGIMKRAAEKGISFKVVASETRPLYQGRKTARELAEAGIDVTLVVDGAMEHFIGKTDIVLVGGDAILSDGSLINKVGTAVLARMAKLAEVPFYSSVELAKFDFSTALGRKEPIEVRPPEEVWKNPPKGVRIVNYAFDVVRARFLTAYITEKGIFAPEVIPLIAEGSKP